MMSLLISCSKKNEAPVYQSDWEQMELRGKVKQITETDNTIVNPEWMAYGNDDFINSTLLEYYLSLLAYCEDQGLDIYEVMENGTDNLEDFEFYPEEQNTDGNAYKVYIFNENGDMEREISYMETMNANPTDQIVNTYDAHHRLLRSDHLKENLTCAFYYEYNYNPDGFMTREYYWPSFGDSYEYIYEYNAKNYRTRTERYGADTLTNVSTYSYDAAGNLQEETYKNEEYFDKWRYEYYHSGKRKNKEASRGHYDKNDILVSAAYTTYSDDMTERWEAYVNEEGDTTSVYYYRMDENGEDIYEAFYEQGMDVPSSVYTWTYDDHGNITMAEWNGMEPSEYYCSTFEYDSKGRQTEYTWFSLEQGATKTRIETVYNNDRVQAIETYMQLINLNDAADSTDEYLIRREVYHYDAVGNWIKREVYKVDTDDNEWLVAMQTREIEYY